VIGAFAELSEPDSVGRISGNWIPAITERYGAIRDQLWELRLTPLVEASRPFALVKRTGAGTG